MAQKLDNLQKIIEYIGSLPVVAEPAELIDRIADAYSPGLWSLDLVAKSSWKGFLADHARQWLKVDPAGPRLDTIFKKTFSSCDPAQIDSLSDAGRGLLYRLKYIYAPVSEAEDAPLRRLGELVRDRMPAEGGPSAVHWSQDPAVLKGMHLASQEGALPKIHWDGSLLQSVFSNGSSEDLKSTQNYLDYLKYYIRIKKLPLEEATELITQAAEAEEFFTKGQSLGDYAQTMTNHLAQLDAGKKRLIFAGTAGRQVDLDSPIFRGSGLEQISKYLKEDPKALAHQLTEAVCSTFEKAEFFSENIQPLLEGGAPKLIQTLKDGLAKSFFPKLHESLLSNQSWKNKILLAFPELLRLGAAHVSASVSASISSMIAERFISFLGREGADRLFDAAISGNLEDGVKAAIEAFILDFVSNIQQKTVSRISGLSSYFPSYFPEIIRSLTGI